VGLRDWRPLLAGAGALIAFAAVLVVFYDLGVNAARPAAPVAVQARRAPAALAAPVQPPAQTFEKLTPAAAQLLNEATPFSKLANPAAKPFAFHAATPLDRGRALTCLTMAVYYEAANQGPDGEAAVAQVILNRVRNPIFPKTVCGVVLQGSQLPTGCQFTFTCDGSLARRPDEAGWTAAAQVAGRALDGYVSTPVGNATHYHTMWVVPTWRLTVVKLVQIGAHIFYRWNGPMGVPGAFTGAYAGNEPAPPAIQGFSTGIPTTAPAVTEPTQVAMATTAPPAPEAKPERVVVVAAAAPAALQAASAAPLSLAKIEPVRSSNFGQAPSATQHLPVVAN
jgi:spore germination cell wall hydrolase CwlJ-like protein